MLISFMILAKTFVNNINNSLTKTVTKIFEQYF